MSECVFNDKWFSPLPCFPVCPFLRIYWFYYGLTGIRDNRLNSGIVTTFFLRYFQTLFAFVLSGLSYIRFSFYKIFMGSQRLDLISDHVDHFYKLGGLCRGDPGKLETTGLDPHIFNKVLKQRKFSSGIVITFQVMAVSRMSPGHPDAVCALSESGQNKLRTHSSGTGDPNHPDMGWILHPADPRKIGGAVTAPVA
jgi:hypothetical protein